MAKQDSKAAGSIGDFKVGDFKIGDLALEGVLAKATDVATDILASEPATQAIDFTTELAAEATKFIKKNPWAAVLGAAAIGYYLGSTRNRGGGSQ